MKWLKLSLALLVVSGCASHQYESLEMEESKNGYNYSLDEETLTVQYQEYQFSPNTTEVLIKCRKAAKQVAKELSVEVLDFDYTTERNSLLGMTSCLAFGELK